MVDKYFVNCRGATFNKVHATEWTESGGMPRMASPFSPYAKNLDEKTMTFMGSTKTSNWLHWNSDEASNQIDSLKTIGVNLIRVYGDMFCWAEFKDRYLKAVEELTKLCNSKRMYIQWVLFDGYTDEDTASTGHELGYFDPSTPYESVSWGIKRWQRCPNINENDLHDENNYHNFWYGLPTRTASSMTTSGDAYVTDMMSTAGKYKATLAWEVFHDVNILATEPSGYDFILSALNKVNSLKTIHQKTTFSAKYINALSATVGGAQLPDVYSSGIVERLTPLVDFVCELTTNFTTLGFINSYLRLRDFSTKTGKPVMIVDSFNDSLMSPFDLYNFSKDFKIGVICEGMVDRSFSRKPYNSTKGILYDDGTARRLLDASSVSNKAYADGLGKFDTVTPSEKSNFETLPATIEASSFDRFNAFEETGAHSWSAIYTASRNFPELSAIPVGYSPMAHSVSSTFGGWGIIGDASSYQNSGLFSTLDTIISELEATPLSALDSWATSHSRDKFGYKILSRLIKLTEDLDMHKGHNYYNTPNYLASDTSGFIASSYQESVFSSASAFMPVSLTKDNIYNASPFIGTPKYFSAIAVSEGAYRDNANYFQKPLCYWVRDDVYLSGSCYYLTSQSVDVSVLDYTETNIVGDFIDWVAYDIRLRAWANDLYNAYVNLNNNLRDYLINSLGDSRVSNYLQEQSYKS
tara:strand:+ start:2771 stop:4852 length:2082 start_codon:yes stop_codon:yes gene_type:complete